MADSGLDAQANYARFSMKEKSLDAYRSDRRGKMARTDEACQIPKG